MQDSSQTPAVEFRNVTMDFDGVLALDDVSFRLEHGEMLFITGISASGKSVLMRLAIGLEPPTSGQIFVDGTEIDHMDERHLLTLRTNKMGIVFQENSLFTSMSVYDNTAYRLVEHGWDEAATDEAVHQILRFVGLDESVDLLPAELSIGMRRRLELARALVGWPRVMLFDEPTSGLDPMTQKSVMNLIISARDTHDVSSLYVTKEMHELKYLAEHRAEGGDILEGGPPSRVMLLDAGRIVFLGPVAEFFAGTDTRITAMTHPQGSRSHN